MTTFNKENIESLQTITTSINSLLSDHCNGSLMAIQLQCLGERIKDFIEHPIVANSGLI